LAAKEEMILVDTNVLLDVLTDDPNWAEWSIVALRDYATAEPLAISDIVYAELAGHATSQRVLDDDIAPFKLSFERAPKAALYLAGQVYARYRRAGGLRSGVLPDFLIGAHAQAVGARLLTRDSGHYRTYFPKVALIAPE
jgi:predicted nucleic acid-binding protein